MAPTQTSLTDSAFGPQPTIDLGVLEDGAELGGRARRAMSSRMLVLPDFDREEGIATGEYRVVRASGTYRVTPGGDPGCDCPDARHRGATCKHLRRVAREITEGRVPAGEESAERFFSETVPVLASNIQTAEQKIEEGRATAGEGSDANIEEVVERFHAELEKAISRWARVGTPEESE